MKSRHTVFKRTITHPPYKLHAVLYFEDMNKKFKPFKFLAPQINSANKIGVIHQPEKSWKVIQMWEGELLLLETKYLAQT